MSHQPSPIGDITLASDGDTLVGLWFDGQRFFGAGLDLQQAECDNLPVFDETRRWLEIYFSGKSPDFTPRLTLRGSAFQKRVWEALLAIPYGSTVTYGTLARRIGLPSAEAIGGAVGHNPISLIVPCHRVVGSDGTLTGYAAGLDRKACLLRLEQTDLVV